MENSSDEKLWIVYIVECSDKKKSLYTGITNNLEKRLEKHNSGAGAKFTRGRTPITLLRSFSVKTKSEALKLELKIKALTRTQKLELINSTENNK